MPGLLASSNHCRERSLCLVFDAVIARALCHGAGATTGRDRREPDARPDARLNAMMPPESQGTALPRARLVGRRILVVGAGQNDYGETDPPIGNGRAMAVLFAREGARVAVADRDAESAEATTARILGEGGSAVTVIADMARSADPQTMVAE